MRLASVCLTGCLLLWKSVQALVTPPIPYRSQLCPRRSASVVSLGCENAESVPRVWRAWLKRSGIQNLWRRAHDSQTTGMFEVTTTAELESYFADEARRFRDRLGQVDSDQLLSSLSVRGDTQIIGSPDHPDYTHPVAKLMHDRRRKQSQNVDDDGERPDGFKVALVVEGGGMRGCVSAGMVCALHHLGLRDSVDVVYGSSAGSIIGAFFVTGQVPWFGPEVYYDKLTTAGKEFIDTAQLPRVLGVGWADPRRLKDILQRSNDEKPVLNLAYLVGTTLQKNKPIDWEKLSKRQKLQPLKVVASNLSSEEPIVMDMEHGHFHSLQELCYCMHASCLLPGIAGPVMNFKMVNRDSDKPNFVLENNFDDPDYDPLGDAMYYAPIPYESAHKDGATHVVVLRTRPDGEDVTGESKWLEKLINKRFFLRKNSLPKIYDYMRKHLHKKLYAKNVIELNEAANDQRHYKDITHPHTMTVALPPGSKEVSRLETGRENIFDGVRRGFARAYDALVEDPAERGRGHIVARQYFPDEIMEYNPAENVRTDVSAYAAFMDKRKASHTNPL